MKAKTLKHRRIFLRTNIFLCLIVAVGFALTAVIGYRTNLEFSQKNIERVSTLTAEGVYQGIAKTFAKPIDVSSAMANDRFLKDFLGEETDRLNDDSYTETLKNYLAEYKRQYGYESVFLVSETTKRYYNFGGVDRVLDDPDDPENGWYYAMKTMPRSFCLVIDNDQAAEAKNEITVFVNCKIEDGEGNFMGAAGVGVVVDHFQALMQSYEAEFGVRVCLLDEKGAVQISPRHCGYGEAVDWFSEGGYSDAVKRKVLDWKKPAEGLKLWVEEKGGKDDFIVVRYFPELKWYLLIEQNTDEAVGQLNAVLLRNAFVVLAIIALVWSVVAFVLCKFDKKMTALSRLAEETRRSAFEQVTGHMFENIYELDITRNRAGNRTTEDYFKSLGVPENTPFDKALEIVAEKQIKEEFREGYVRTFTPENVRRAYGEGRDSLSYEFMILGADGAYHWMRIVVQIVRWESDGSLHMFSYRQSIDAEKRQEQKMRLLAQTDEMTGFLNKMKTQARIEELLRENPSQRFALFIFDIDNFKSANDKFGHSFGDAVILEFTDTIRAHFQKGDVTGRIGGDEFLVFCAYAEPAFLRASAAEISAKLDRFYEKDDNRWKMSASIGVALAPEDGGNFDTLYKNADAALYRTKAKGKNGYTFYTQNSGKETTADGGERE